MNLLEIPGICDFQETHDPQTKGHMNPPTDKPSIRVALRNYKATINRLLHGLTCLTFDINLQVQWWLARRKSFKKFAKLAKNAHSEPWRRAKFACHLIFFAKIVFSIAILGYNHDERNSFTVFSISWSLLITI